MGGLLNCKKNFFSAVVSKAKCGFSLIELAIVVAVIGAIATIATVQYRAYKLKLLRTDALTIVKTIEKSLLTMDGLPGVSITVGFGRTYEKFGCTGGSTTAPSPEQLGLSAEGCDRMIWSFIGGATVASGQVVPGTFGMTILSRYMSWDDFNHYNALTGQNLTASGTPNNYDRYIYTAEGGLQTVHKTEW